jgi:hypothetical protein
MDVFWISVLYPIQKNFMHVVMVLGWGFNHDSGATKMHNNSTNEAARELPKCRVMAELINFATSDILLQGCQS